MPIDQFKAKKRRRGFLGTQKQFVTSSPQSPEVLDALEQEESVVERPVPLETAKSKKLAISLSFGGPSQAVASTSQATAAGYADSSSSSDSDDELLEDSKLMKGYRAVDCESLGKAVSEVGVCVSCQSPLVVLEDFGQRRGLVSTLKICCTNSECDMESKITNPYSSKAKSLNGKSVLAMREIGRGSRYMKTFFGLMDMLPPVTPRAYKKHNQALAKASMSAASDNMIAASEYLHRLHGVEPDEILDIKVTCDGTWSKRGFTAIHGVVAVISYDSGQVLDFEVLSKSCPACKQQKTQLTEEEFDVWLDGHKEECLANHDGSSPAMECSGALTLWKRSVETRCLRYTEVISDGDSKTIAVLNQQEPYGSGVQIRKHECVGHVQKRLGKRVRAVKKELVKATKGPKEQLKVLTAKLKEMQKLLRDAKRAEKSGRGRGRGGVRGRRGRGGVISAEDTEGDTEEGEPHTDAEMAVVVLEVEIDALQDEIEALRPRTVVSKLTDPEIDKLQSLYRKAIVDHPGDLTAMTTACWAVYHHYISTDEDPQHDFCPDGESSWCKYQQALARGEDPPATNTLIPADYREDVGKVFEDLCDASLLKRCLLGATQNRNESFHSMIWARCSKTDFSGTTVIQIATSLAVMVFNSGNRSLTQITDKLGIEAGPLCCAELAARDCTTVHSASYMSETVKERRKSRRREKKGAEEAYVEAEGVTYEAGGF